DLRGPDHVACWILDRRNSDGDVYKRAILAPPHSLIMLNALALADALHDVALFLRAVLRNDESDRLANRLFRCITVEINSGAVPAGDPPIEVETKDCIVR